MSIYRVTVYRAGADPFAPRQVARYVAVGTRRDLATFAVRRYGRDVGVEVEEVE